MPRKIFKDLDLRRLTNRGALTGDAPTVSGEDLLEHRLSLRMEGTPGAVTHRPDFGAGLLHKLGEIANTSGMLSLMRIVRLEALKEDDVVEASSKAYVENGQVVIELAVVKRGETQPQTIVLRRNT